MGAYREGLLSGLGDGLGLTGGWERYKRYISLPENRKNARRTGKRLHAPAILPGSRCGFKRAGSDGGRVADSQAQYGGWLQAKLV